MIEQNPSLMNPSTPPLRLRAWLFLVLGSWLAIPGVMGTPANRAALEKHYDRFLTKELNRCTTCHLPSEIKSPESLDDFPHNPFGHRLRVLGQQLGQAGQKHDLPTRLAMVATEDSDGDKVDNETEILLGHNPGNANDTPKETTIEARRAEFARFLASYRWQPFEPVQRPPVPAVKNRRWTANPVDAFLAAEHEARGLQPRAEASKEVLLRRLHLDLIGLAPTPEEQRAYLADPSPDAYEKVVNRLLDDPRHGERWGRHWMDVWRYSDWAGWTDGGQVRDSQRHIWRWRDWIVEALNADKPYDRMLVEMLAADELAPDDTNALRATGFLVRNYKMLSREQWLEDTLKHTSQAFLGVTVGCAKCHDHMYDPIAQREYYQMRAIFEPHQVRTDRVPGQTNRVLDGLVRVFDTDTNAPTWFYQRGDERHPDTNAVILPGVPRAFGGTLQINPVKLPALAAHPDQREFVRDDVLAASEKALATAREALAKVKTNTAAPAMAVAVAEARHSALLAVLKAEKIEAAVGRDSFEWKAAATNAVTAQRALAVAEARARLQSTELAWQEAAAKTNSTAQADAAKAKVKQEEAAKALAEATKKAGLPGDTAFQPRATEDYPVVSTGRRLAFARWLTHERNPLTARVAMNQIWLRHFGRGLVPTTADFGRSGKPASHPPLLDWLAAEFIARDWSMKAMHRLLVTSSAYRLASTPDEANARVDPDNIYLWRMNSRRLEAEAVRDNLLWVAGALDLTRGGPDIDHALGLTSKRRSLYLRLAAEKEVEFLKIFDGPSVTECYERRPSVMPQQALALANSEMALTHARTLARRLAEEAGEDATKFITLAFRRILARRPTGEEVRVCGKFLQQPFAIRRAAVAAGSTLSTQPAQRACENLVLVLLNHNDFVTVR